ncbi:helix-turn-helix domain-containing protein [Bradyrhizobium diazoefficiens]|nr:helix-turn-helix domain-containing protein [Bradyrhizobium diazoefficiens]MBR0851482.1 helix-turn-helix domain-containing protein [Bradyrhizobium diazoefficiens]
MSEASRTEHPDDTGAASFDAYAQYVSSLQTVELPDRDASTFEWSVRLRAMSPASFSRGKASHHISRRTPKHCAKVGLDHIIAYYRLSGHGQLQTESEARLTKPGDLTFMDMSRPMLACGPIDTVCVGFPRALIAPLVKDVDALHGLVLAPDTALGRLAAAHMNALAAEIGRMDADEARLVAEATANLLAVCANSSLLVSEQARVRARPALLVTIRHHIDRNLADPTLGPETIARQFALSRSTLFRLFHPFGGIELYIRRRRLARAYQTLARSSSRSNEYIYQVAEACGFTSPSGFSRAFRLEFGQTPSDVIQCPPNAWAIGTLAAGSTSLTQCLHDLVFQAA